MRRELYFASPDELNDPFELRFQFLLDAPHEDKVVFIAEALLRDDPSQGEATARFRAEEALRWAPDMAELVAQNIVENLTESARTDPGVLCLCARPDNILLWSHYADAHRGICVGFRTGPGMGFFERPAPVVYQPEPLRVSLYEPDVEKRFRAALTKAAAWSYEEEWRVVAVPPPLERAAGVQTFPVDALSRVILGTGIGSTDRDAVLQWVQVYPAPVEIFTAELGSDRYHLNIVPLETSGHPTRQRS